MKKCICCGMPMNKKNDFAMGDESKDYCVYCAKEDGSMKSFDEAVIRQISTETDVVGHCGIFRIRSQHRSRTCGGIVDRCLHHQFLIVLDPVITGIEVDDVSQQCEDEDPQHDTHGF